ncbi:MAG: 6-phosphofructokinase [Clostridia bacterium]|nr:6-phosphofructokinase [Clostridia bacterium]
MLLKGNAIVGQSGGPTAAINATLSGVIRGAMASDAIPTIYGAFNGVEGMLADTICNLSEVFANEADLRVLEATPAAALGSCRRKLPKLDDAEGAVIYEQLLTFFKKHDIRYFFYIGGNDSMDTVAKLTAWLADKDWEMRVMGVPKTIDNDLVGTDHTPGFGSAAKYIAASMQEIIRDTAVYTMKAVTIVEIMGRDAGWLTASAALTRKVCGVAPDLVYLPERVFDYDRFYADVRAALEVHPNVVVAVSEGIKLADGHYVGEGSQSGAVDVFGHRYLSGTGKTLEMAVKAEIGCKVRSVELNILQRCASHIASGADISESVRVGRAAVENAVGGLSGKMMCFIRREGDYYVDIQPGDIAKIANMIREVPDEFINAEGNNITDAGIDYLLPLIQGECDIPYENGLPKHFVIPR